MKGELSAKLTKRPHISDAIRAANVLKALMAKRQMDPSWVTSPKIKLKYQNLVMGILLDGKL